jgi:hypothetical protein
MSLIQRSSRTIAATLTGAAVLGSSGVLATAVAAAPSPPKTVTATRITRPPATLAPGSRVPSRDVVGQRTFTNATRGVALATAGQADYAVATTDGGRTWKTAGPALHLHAAQAPLAVIFIGAVNARTVYAWGGGGQVVDTTNDGGKTWYRALFTSGSPVAVVHDPAGHLLAFIQSFNGKNAVEYISKNGGRTWRR